MKKLILLAALLCAVSPIAGKTYPKDVQPVKNVILMIPDGTSIGVVSASRWYKFYNRQDNRLNIDPYICGTVQTFSSNAPIGDSAPTTSCYMTGVPQQTGNVAIYPVADPSNDLYPVNPDMAYQPLVTILEAARIEQNKATGLVVTCEFPHATPADCSAHYYSRGAYDKLAPQMAYNNLNVMFGGGNGILTDDIKQHFAANGTTLLQDDLTAFRNYSGDRVWALWGDRALPYDLDRDPAQVPSLEEMTRKALDILSKNENGFFLMVEGSQVDWAAHANDPVGCIGEFLAFDKAVGAALEFAREDGNTAIVILPDHGNSGFTIGRRDLPSYDKASIDKLFGGVSKIKRTSQGLEQLLLQEKPDRLKDVFRSYTGIELTDEDIKALTGSKNYKLDDYMKASESKSMGNVITGIINRHLWFGFTSGGHTGEEVFLAAYHPQGTIPTGMNTNMQINAYLFDVLGLKTPLTEQTRKIFAKHTDVFKGLEYKLDKSGKFPVLKVTKGKNKLEVPAFKSVASLNGQSFDLGSVTVYIDKNNTFYLPSWLVEKLN
ncbi:MAG: alkaline phosphatase [Prevotella sp.]|jgi:alkaline phosphatase|nr:alkaline phosphatase [Prevotella sp.]